MTFGILGILFKNEQTNSFFCLTVLKSNLFIRFLEVSEGTKNSFLNYLTFSNLVNLFWFAKSSIVGRGFWIHYERQNQDYFAIFNRM